MKKKLLIGLLSISTMLCFVGCGTEETTSKDVIVTEEDVQTTKTVGNNSISEEIDASSIMNEVLANYTSQDYVVITAMGQSTNFDNEEYYDSRYEVLFNWKDNLACSFSEDAEITYYDFANYKAYVSNEDLTGFYVAESKDIESYYRELYDAILSEWMETDTRFEVQYDSTDNIYYATNMYSIVGTEDAYIVNILIDAETMLPTSTIITEVAENSELELEDGTKIEGGLYKKNIEKYYIEYISKDSDEFITFSEAIKLPADDECTQVIVGTIKE